MANEQIMADWQRECEMRANADPFFQHITVLNYKKGDIAQEFLACLTGLNVKPAPPATGGRAGATVCILQPMGDIANRNVRFSPLDMTLTFLVLTYPLFNDDPAFGTGKSAESICMRLADLFHLFHPVGITTPFVAKKPFMVPTKIPVPTGREGEALLPVAYECGFETRSSRDREMRQPDIPVITTNGANITLTCATDAVDIYYTLDGSPPAPPHINAAATRYETAFAPASSGIIRAVALRQQQGSDWTPSDIAWQAFDVTLTENMGNTLGTASEDSIKA